MDEDEFQVLQLHCVSGVMYMEPPEKYPLPSMYPFGHASTESEEFRLSAQQKSGTAV